MSYEKQKMGNGEFDLADFVNGLHNQLRYERYKGDEMHFVYIFCKWIPLAEVKKKKRMA